MGEQVFARRNSYFVTAARQLSYKRVCNQNIGTGLEIRPNADTSIGLLTLGTASPLYVANRTTLERMGLAASRRLVSWMQSLETT